MKKTMQIWEGNTEATKGLEMKERWGKKEGCVSGLRMSCNLMSLNESWLSELTQFFALLVTVLSLMMFAADYWCKSQCWIVFFWSYVFLRVASLFATCMCRMLNLAQGAHAMTSPTLWSRHPFKICLQCLNHRHASVPARVNTECGWPCARLRTMCIQRLHKTDKEIKTRVGSAGRGGKAAICGHLVKYGTKMKQRRGEDVPGRSLQRV